jgi:hypothetical protein
MDSVDFCLNCRFLVPVVDLPRKEFFKFPNGRMLGAARHTNAAIGEIYFLNEPEARATMHPAGIMNA